MSGRDPVLAAGAVCWRATDVGVEVLLVHRTQHRDVSLPKGKVDAGELLPRTAAREVAEETGLSLALGVPLGTVEYALPSGRPKIVHYWAAEAEEDAIDRSTFQSNDEIEHLRWVRLDAARDELSYEHDVDVLERFAAHVDAGTARTFAIIALRHGKALAGGAWDGPDATRPLLQRGIDQAASAAPAIAAYRPEKLLSSTAARCLATIEPLARLTGLPVKPSESISQDAYRSSGARVRKAVRKRLDRRVTTVLCSHGPVLPQIVDAAAGASSSAELSRAAGLATGEFAVLHLPMDAPETGPVAVEVHSSGR